LFADEAAVLVFVSVGVAFDGAGCRSTKRSLKPKPAPGPDARAYEGEDG